MDKLAPYRKDSDPACVQERWQKIAGLKELIEFWEKNPSAPIPAGIEFHVDVTADDNAEKKILLDILMKIFGQDCAPNSSVNKIFAGSIFFSVSVHVE